MIMTRILRLLANRVILGLIVFLVLVGMWEFKWKPQYKPSYEQGIALYRAGKYVNALDAFQRSYDIAPNAVDVIIMLGWTELKLHHWEEARFYFARALRIDPRLEEARIGISFVAVETGRGELDAKLLYKILDTRKGDPNLRILVAAALANNGKSYDAADVYRGLVKDRDYGHSAQIALQLLYGLDGFEGDTVPQTLPAAKRSLQMQMNYRAGQGQFWALQDGNWTPFPIAGIDLGPGAPGFYPGAPPTDGKIYAQWLKYSNSLNANVLRAYTLLPPSFYRAYNHYLAEGGTMTLFQQIWISDPPNRDLYDPRFVEEVRSEIRYVVDSIHGHGEVPPRNARGSGIYDADIASHVSALLLGREIEPTVAIRTNVSNIGKDRFHGKYISIDGATATETWFAEMMDYLIAYETQTYNSQHPVALVNWPPLDPLNHPTESSTLEEVKFKIRRGEQLAMPKDIEDDTDVVAIDEAKFKFSSDFHAGLFASYHVYPYFPDFLILDPRYLRARDSQGTDPIFGYLQELHQHIPYPLVVTEYGVPTSMGISHFHPYGWHHGGQTEDAQGEFLVRMTRAIREAGCAGGVAFELVDEWYKHNWLTVDFENPLDRANLWLNDLDPEKRYGVVGFHTSKWKLFAGDDAAWANEKRLYSAGGEAGARLRSVEAASDEGYLYLKLDLTCIDCGKKVRGSKNADTAATLGKDRAFAVAINTLPNLAGLKQLPFGGISLAGGADFLLYLGDESNTRLLVADNYNPYQLLPKPGVPNETELLYRRGYTPKLEGRGNFQEFVVETNRRRFGRDGTQYPAQRYSRSVLRFGNGNPDAPDYDSLSEWYADSKKNVLLVRIPWGKLLVTDPSSRQAFHGFDDKVQVRTLTSTGIDLAVFELTPGGAGPATASVLGTFPAARGGTLGTPAQLAWKTWQTVPLDPYFKKSFYALQKEFAAMGEGSVHHGAVLRAGDPAAVRGGTGQ